VLWSSIRNEVMAGEPTGGNHLCYCIDAILTFHLNFA
jgi:hypothetical protein